MTRGRWLTPDTPAAGYSCYTLRLPNSEAIKAIVNGALLPLLSPFNFEQEGDLTPDDTAALFQAVYDDWLNGRNCMIGTIVAYATAAVPDNCLACDGTHYLKADYPALAAALHSVWTVDSTHFKVPDLRGRVVEGIGDAHDGITGAAMNAAVGQNEVTLSVAELPAHHHTWVQVSGAPLAAGPGALFTNVSQATVNTGSTGGDTPHQNMQPTLALGYAIVAR
jgi:microcystin-dependent protein